MTHFFQSLKHYPKQYKWALLSGVLVATSFPPFPAWASLFCWTPLWYFSLKSNQTKEILIAGWLTQFVIGLIGFHWVAYTAHAFGGLPWFLSILVLLLFSALVHIHIPITLLINHKIFQKKSSSTALTLLSLVILHSLAERFWPMIFPWHMGYSWLYSRLEIFQLADKIGFHGLSFLLLLFNASFTWVLLNWKTQRTRSLLVLAAAPLIFLALNIAGALFKNIPTETQKVHVLMVQANIGQFDKVQAEANLRGVTDSSAVQRIVLEKYIQLTEEALRAHPESQIIVWPETALADYLDLAYLSRDRALTLKGKIREWNRALMTGAYSREAGTNNVYNGFFIFDNFGNLAAPGYRKSQLLVFGERLPFGDIFPWLYKILPFVSSFQAGPGPQVLPLPFSNGTFQAAPQICYESMYAWFSREGANQGAQLLVNVTNDSWFGTHFEPYQHGTITWARAIENRRPLIRSTNTGESSIINAEGKVLIRSPLHREWFGVAEVGVSDTGFRSFYTKYGHRDGFVLALALLLIAAGVWRHGRSQRN